MSLKCGAVNKTNDNDCKFDGKYCKTNGNDCKFDGKYCKKHINYIKIDKYGTNGITITFGDQA